MSKILVILVLCQVHLIMAQSKKNQIEQLQYTADSLNRVIDMDRNTNKQKIQELNSAGTIPKDLKAFTYVVEKEVEIGYENVVGQDSISRFANTSKNRNKNKNRSFQNNKK